MKKKLKKNSH